MRQRISGLTLIFLIILAGIFPVKAATNEGYGEDQTSLGQFVDSFEDSGNVSVTVDVVRNSTLEVMELNYTVSGTPIYENYTEYTEVDPNNRFAITDTTIVVSSFSNHDDHHYVYFDYGAGYFTDFVHDLDARGRDDSGASGNDRMWVWLLAYVLDEPIDLINNNEEFIGILFMEFDNGDPNDPEISLREYENAVLFLDKYEPASRDVWYYFRIIKSGTDLKVGIYSTAALRDAGDATDGDFDNLALTLQNDYSFRYIYAVTGLNTGTPTQRIISGDIKNLTIGRTSEGYEPEGYFTTVDYLSNSLANGSALTALINTSIPASTQILVEFSEDNITWVLNDWQPLAGGFEAVDLRDLNYSTGFHFRFNLSTIDGSITPRVYQNRLITTIGNASTFYQNLTGEWIYYNLTAINVSIGIHDDGFLNSTYFIDGDTYNCSEVVGVPGYVVDFNVTGIDTRAISLWLVNYVYYDGSASHEINVEVWNFTSSAFVEIGEIPDMLGFEWHNFSVYGLRIPNDFVNSTGALVGRFYHSDAGNINHDIFFDRINVLAFVPLESFAPAAEVFQFFWIVLAIALMLIGIVISKMWQEAGDS